MAQILGVTKSEAVQLLSALDKYWQLEHTGIDQPAPEFSVTSFLGCFEGAPLSRKTTPTKPSLDQSLPGSSGTTLIRKINIRKGLSAALGVKLGNYEECSVCSACQMVSDG